MITPRFPGLLCNIEFQMLVFKYWCLPGLNLLLKLSCNHYYLYLSLNCKRKRRKRAGLAQDGGGPLLPGSGGLAPSGGEDGWGGELGDGGRDGSGGPAEAGCW